MEDLGNYHLFESAKYRATIPAFILARTVVDEYPGGGAQSAVPNAGPQYGFIALLARARRLLIAIYDWPILARMAARKDAASCE